jgi:uncharacterized protein YcfJ
LLPDTVGDPSVGSVIAAVDGLVVGDDLDHIVGSDVGTVVGYLLGFVVGFVVGSIVTGCCPDRVVVNDTVNNENTRLR